MRRRLAQLLLPLAALSLVGVALLPLADRWGARHGARQQIGDAFEALLAGAIARGAQQERSCEFSAKPASSLLQMRLDDEPLASWASIGGCGAGGGSSATASGAKWIGRGVTGGLVDLQCLASQSVAKGDYYSTLNTRIGTSILQKWNFGLNIPLLYKVGTVEVLGTERSAKIAGFGYLSL